MKTSTKIVLSILALVLLFASLLVATIVPSAVAVNSVLEPVLVITNSANLSDGQVVGSSLDLAVTIIKAKALGGTEPVVTHTTTALDMETFRSADGTTQGKIKKFLSEEYRKHKKIIFFREKQPVSLSDAYTTLGISPKYNISRSGNMDEMIGVTVEQTDGGTVIHYFFNNNKDSIEAMDRLVWLVSGSDVQDVLPEWQIPPSSALAALSGDGVVNKTDLPVIVSYDLDWNAKLALYLRRTEIIGKDSKTPKTTWQGTSALTLSRRVGSSTSMANILDVDVEHNCAGKTPQNLFDFEPSTTIGSTSKSFTISAGVDSEGKVNVGTSISMSTSQPDVTIIARPDFTNNKFSWNYDYAEKSSGAKNGGIKMIQQTTFDRSSVGNAMFSVNFRARFGSKASGCSSEQCADEINGDRKQVFTLEAIDQK